MYHEKRTEEMMLLLSLVSEWRSSQLQFPSILLECKEESLTVALTLTSWLFEVNVPFVKYVTSIVEQ